MSDVFGDTMSEPTTKYGLCPHCKSKHNKLAWASFPKLQIVCPENHQWTIDLEKKTGMMTEEDFESTEVGKEKDEEVVDN